MPMPTPGRAALVCAALMNAALIAWAGVPDFAQLPHATRPLVQVGSDNVLPNADLAAGLEGWGAKGDVSVVEIDGERVLRLGPIVGEQAASVQAYIREPRGGVLYRLRFEVLIPEDAELSWGTHSGLYGWFTHSSPTKQQSGALRINEYRRTGAWMSREFFLFTHPDTNALYVSLSWQATAGAALLRRFEVVEAPVSVSEGRVVLETPQGDWAELPDELPPGAEPDGPLAWVPADTDTLRPRLLPDTDAASRALTLAGTRGEICIGAVALRTPEELPEVRLRMSALTGEAGELAATTQLRQAIFMPRRTDYYGRGRTFHRVPDFFLDGDNFSAPGGETSGFWVNLRIPGNAASGEYGGALTVTAGQRTWELPVRVRVYPFALADLGGRIMHLYADSARWSRMTDEQVLAEIADIRDHGYESLPLSAGGEMVFEAGHCTEYRLSEDAMRMIRLAQQGGLHGPFGFWTGRFPETVRARLGLPEDALAATADTWPEAVTQGVIEAQRALKTALTTLGLEDPFIIAIDEPGYWKAGSPERYAWDMRVARESGWDTYCTTSTPPPDPLGMFVTYHCYGGGQVYLDRNRAGQVAAATRAAGQQFWYYCTGAYSGQIGVLCENRYLAGFMFARCGADGTASWTFQRPRGNAFDDFGLDDRGNETLGQPCITYPDPRAPGANLNTPHWEGLRQAWYDHRYVRTLERASAHARAQGQETTADAAQARLDELMTSLPWNGEPMLWPQMTNARLDEVRTAIAEEIVRLRAER